MGLFNFFQKEIAIDLGTANTIIIQNGKIVVDEPSIVAIDIKTDNIIAIGKKAMEFLNHDFQSQISLYPTISELLKEI